MRLRSSRLTLAVIAVSVLHSTIGAAGGPATPDGPAARAEPILRAATTDVVSGPVAVGEERSVAYGLSRTGRVVGRWFHPIYTDDMAFQWTPRTGVSLLGYGVAYRTNAAGLVVGRNPWSPGEPNARVWTRAGVESTIGMGEALDVNEAGQVVGWTWLPTLVQQAFTWSEADGYRRLGTLLGSDTYFAGDSEARGINDDGIVVGWSIAERGHHAVRWSSAEGFTDLTPTASTDTAANAINNLGTIVGVTGSFRDAGLVMAWTREGIEAPLDGAPAGDTWPAAINDLGQVVGRFATGGETHAFFWDPTAGWVDLGSGAAHDLNERGMIAGAVGADPTMQQAVIWEVTPRVQVTALVRTIDRLAADARVLASARVQSHLAKRWLAAGHRRRAAACLDRVAQDLARIERRAPALATVLRSLSTAARGLARQLGSCASRSSEGYGRPTGGVGTNSGAL